MSEKDNLPVSGDDVNDEDDTGTDDSSENKPEDKNADQKKLNLAIPDEVRSFVDDLPDPQKQAVAAILFGVRKISTRTSFKGPLPHPSLLEKYNGIIPNGADRITKMAERQSEHRMKMESDVVHRELNQSGRGQTYGLIIALAFLAVAGFLVYTGHDVAGTIIGSIDLVALVAVFVLGKYYQTKELAGKE